MPYDKRFGEFVRELLEGLGEIRIRPMFGGAGVFSGELMFALIFDDTLFLRADEANEAALALAGARRFIFRTKTGEAMEMNYWSLPDAAADDPEEAVGWARASLSAAARKAAGKRPARKQA